MFRRWQVLLLIGSLALAFVLLAVVRLARVEGSSMEPTLAQGDLVVGVAAPGIAGWVSVGDLVLVDVPPGESGSARLAIKRVRSVRVGQRSRFFELGGDNPSRSRDSRSYGLIHEDRIEALVVYAVRRGESTERSPAGR